MSYDAVASFPDAFVLWDAEDRMILCNDRYRALLPEGLGDAVGVHRQELAQVEGGGRQQHAGPGEGSAASLR